MLHYIVKLSLLYYEIITYYDSNRPKLLSLSINYVNPYCHLSHYIAQSVIVNVIPDCNQVGME